MDHAEILRVAQNPELAYHQVCQRSYDIHRRDGYNHKEAVQLVFEEVNEAQDTEQRNVVSINRAEEKEQRQRLFAWLSQLKPSA
jgi:hypothetical protein